jgi:Bacterial Ig-like domain
MASDFDSRARAVITHIDGIESGGVVSAAMPLITGVTDPFIAIGVFDDETLLGTATANAQGDWSLQLVTALPEGRHDLSVVREMEDGIRSASSSFAFTIQTRDFFPLSHADELAADSQALHANVAGLSVATSADSSNPQSYERHASAQNDKSQAFDMVAFLGDHQVLDLSAFTEKLAPAHLPGIGGFDLGGHYNALHISLADVLSLGEQGLFIDDGKQQLIVNGKEGDSVDLTNSHVAGLVEGDWHQQGTTDIGGVIYNVVEHSSANTELLVEQAVKIELH